jgi:hypothetical protein
MTWPRGAKSARWELMGAEIAAGRAEILVAICLVDGHWFPVEMVGQPCPEDHTEDRNHAVNYYALVAVKR